MNEIDEKAYKNARRDYMDVARGICMISIVLGHLSDVFVNKFVFTFHLPVFFIITGYFFKPDESLLVLIKKRIRGLIIPYFFSCLCILMSWFLVNHLFLKTAHDDIKYGLIRWIKASICATGDSYDVPFKIPSIGAIWFLWALFWGCIIFSILVKVSPIKRSLIIVGLFVLARWTVQNICFIPLSIQPACSAVLFIYIGYLWKTNEDFIKSASHSVKVFALIIAVILWYEFVKSFQSFWLVHSDFGRGFSDVIASICASFLVIYISYLLEKRLHRFLAPIRMLGRYSIIALCAHIIELNAFPWGKILTDILGENPEWVRSVWLKIVFKLIWIFLFTYAFSKLKITRRIFNIRIESHG